MSYEGLRAPSAQAFEGNLAQIRGAIGGRETQILAVTKNFDISAAVMAVGAGIRHLGENRVQEAEYKYMPVRRGEVFGIDPRGFTLHMIGHLQSNKAARAVALFDSIDSVDSLRIAEVISLAAQRQGKCMPVMIEVNVGGDPAKSGVAVCEVERLAENIARLPCLELSGLMTILPVGCDSSQKTQYFDEIYKKGIDIAPILGNNKSIQLSMGMSDDYLEAVGAGSTMVRIGSGLFGARV